jgi:hypothetical protein
MDVYSICKGIGLPFPWHTWACHPAKLKTTVCRMTTPEALQPVKTSSHPCVISAATFGLDSYAKRARHCEMAGTFGWSKAAG